MSSYSAGEATVSIVPDLGGFQDRLRAELRTVTVDHSVRIVPDLTDFQARLQAALAAAGAGAGRQGGSAGSSYGDEFSRVVKTRIEAALRSLPEVQIGVATTEAEQKLRDLHTRLETLRDQKIGIDIDAADALAEVEKIRLELDELSRKSPDIQVRVDAGRALAEIAAVREEVNRLDGRHVEPKVDIDTRGATAGISALLPLIAGIGPALIPIGAAAAAGLGGIATLAVAGGAALGVLYLGLSGVITAVGDASAAQKTAGADAIASAKAQEAAAAQVASAQSSLSSAITAADNSAISSAEAVANARRGVADAQRTASAGVANALAGQETAERALTQAEQTAQQAEDALTAARKTAQQQIQDLTLSVADGALAQRQANLSVETSKANLDKVLANPASSVLQREQAQLTYDQAVQQVTDIGVRQGRLQDQKAAADKAGVEGSATVISAQRGVTTAVRGVSTAQDALGKASAAVLEAQRSGAEQVSKAQQSLTDAVRAQGQQAAASQATIASAQRALVTAQDAARDAATKSSAAANKAEASLKALSPAGQEFVNFIVSTLNPVLSRLKDTAQAGLLPGLEDGLKGLLPVMPLVDTAVGKLATTMGELFREAGQALNSPFYRQFITYLGDTGSKTIDQFGHIIGNLATGFAGLLQAFAPLSDGIGAGLLHLSERFAAFGQNTGASSGFQSFLKYVQDVSPLVVKTFVDLGRTLGNLIGALAPFGVVALTVVDDISRLINVLGPTGLVNTLGIAGAAFVGFKIVAGGLTFGPALLAIAGLTAAFAKLYADKGPDGADSGFKTFVDKVNKEFQKDLPTAIDLTNQGFSNLSDLFTGKFLDSSKSVGDNLHALGGIFGQVKDVTAQATIVTNLNKDAQDGLRNAQDKLADTIQKVITKFTILRDGSLSEQTATDNLAAAQDALTKSLHDNGATLDGNTEKGRANRKAVADLTTALQEKVLSDLKADSSTGSLSDAIDHATATTETNRQKLVEQLIQSGFTREAAQKYTDTLLLTPAQIATKATLFKEQADADITALNAHINSLQDKYVTIKVSGVYDPALGGIQDAHGDIHVPGGGVLLRASGGPITGPGGPRDDRIPILSSNGEHMIPADEVNMLGGQAGVYALREVIRAGDLPGFALGGAVRRSIDENGNSILNSGTQPLIGASVDRSIIINTTTDLGGLNGGIDAGFQSFADAMASSLQGAITRQQAAAARQRVGNYGDVGGGSGAIPTGQHLVLIDQALAADGINLGDWPRWEAGMDTLIGRESGWNPNAINLTDSNATAGHPSQGLTQTIPSTFDFFHNSSLPGGITDAAANIAASVNYIRNRYGDISAVQQANPNLPPLGYDTGGYFPPGYSMIYNGTGTKEVALSAPQVDWVRDGMRKAESMTEGGGPQVTQHIYPQAGQSEAQIAADLERRLLFAMR